MRIAVTGGSGFLGTDLVRSLLDAGHSVTILDREPPDTSVSGRITFVHADITDTKVVAQALKNIELVYHIAALVPISSKRYKDFHAVNVDGTRNVLTAARANNARVVFVSTSSPLFDKARIFPVTEETPRSPGYAYGKSKFAAEVVCEEFRTSGLLIAIVRPRMILGPGRLGLIEILSEWIRHNKPIPVLGDGTNKLQFLDVADLTRFLILLTSATPSVFNQDYNLGSTQFSTLREDLESLITAAHSTSYIAPIPRWYRPFVTAANIIGFTPLTFFHLNTIDRTFYFDTSKAQRLLGWEPEYSNAESLIRSYQWYIQNSNHLVTGNSHNRKLKSIGLLRILPYTLHVYMSLRQLLRRICVVLATGFGISMVKIAPSSHGALLAMVGVPFFVLLSPFAQILLLITGFAITTYIASVAEHELGNKDDRRIVIDEMFSVYVTFFLFPVAQLSLLFLILGFSLNRIFDVLKPFPARVTEKFSGGWGIVMDDVISAIYAWIVLMLIVSV